MSSGYDRKPRGTGTQTVRKVAYLAAASADREVRRYLQRAGYCVSYNPPETAADFKQYCERVKSSGEWEEGDVILNASEAANVENVKKALADRPDAQNAEAENEWQGRG